MSEIEEKKRKYNIIALWIVILLLDIGMIAHKELDYRTHIALYDRQEEIRKEIVSLKSEQIEHMERQSELLQEMMDILR